jgi:hypothetical protein
VAEPATGIFYGGNGAGFYFLSRPFPAAGGLSVRDGFFFFRFSMAETAPVFFFFFFPPFSGGRDVFYFCPFLAGYLSVTIFFFVFFLAETALVFFF